MCGIAGAVCRQADNTALDRLASAARLLHHRGPDAGGFMQYANGSVTLSEQWRAQAGTTIAFLHRRLSILDLSPAGWQPMQSPDGRFTITFNGEIYNFIELRAQLEGLGRTFRTQSDTEVVIAAYAQWGTEAFKRFTGMFALALLDLAERTVILARDPFGIKPLYYTRENGALLFASEVPALLEIAGGARRVDADRLYRFLRYGVTDGGGGTLFANVSQLPAACFAAVPLDAPLRVEPQAYWRPACGSRSDITFREAAQGLRERFLRSVDLHLRSDVPVGTALSGGIDSSAIVCAIRAVRPNADIHAFSYVAKDTPFDEERWIDMAASAAGAQVHKVYSDAAELRSELQTLSTVQGEPFGSTSIYAQYRVFKSAAASGIKVMLDGQGADEMLGGYRQYLAARLASLLRRAGVAQARSFFSQASELPGVSKSYLLQKAAEHLLPQAVQQPLRKLVGRETMPAWMNAQWFRDAGVSPGPLQMQRGGQILKNSLLCDLQETSLPALLRYEDRNSMAFSIESRVPFLTTEIVDFVLALPEPYLIAGDGTTKAVFREAMRGLVPERILDRRDKIGFSTPERDWLGTLDAWVRPMLASPTAQVPPLNGSQVRTLWDETLGGGLHRFDFHLWRAFNLIYWSQQFDVTYG
ncbi:MAG: asparagine synthase (glutamine-hydrolyzing) [Candidatus Baltobacteraceae bacterium]